MANVVVDCPACGTRVHFKVTGSQEYQGEHPHGGMVWFMEDCDIEDDCGCGLRTQDQDTELCDQAMEAWEPGEEQEGHYQYDGD